MKSESSALAELFSGVMEGEREFLKRAFHSTLGKMSRLVFLEFVVAIFMVAFGGCDRQTPQSASQVPNANAVASKESFGTFPKDDDAVWAKVATVAGKGSEIEVRAVVGSGAEISDETGQTWKQAAEGLTFSQGTVVRTGAGSKVDVMLGENGRVLRIESNSQVRFVKFKMENTGIEKISACMIELPKGRLSGNRQKMAAASQILVRTHGGIFEPHGEFTLASDGTVPGTKE